MAGKSAALEHAVGKLTLGFAAAGVAIGVESVKAAAKFQTAMELIHTQAGRSQKTVDQMSKAVLAMSAGVATGPDELAKGLYHLASTGMSTAKSLQALKIAAEGAKLGGADLESVTNALNATLASGIKGAQNMSQAMGALNAVVGAGDMRMQDLAEALGTGVLAAVKGFGVNLNDVGAALATFGDNNIRGADAATQLRMAVLFMAKPAAGAKDALQSLGMNSKTLANDMGKGGLGLALTDLHDRLLKAGDTGSKMGQVLLDMFGHKAGTGLAILEQQFSRFQQKQNEVATGSKNFASSWTGYTQTFGYSWDRARTAFQTMTIELGQKLLPTATKAMNWIGTTGVGDLEKFSGWVSRNKTPIEDIAKVLGAIAAFRFATGTLAKIPGMLGLGSKGLGGVGGSILGTAKPIPVYVTNMGKGLPGGPGGGGPLSTAEKDAEKYGPGAAVGATWLTRAGKIATTASRGAGLADPVVLASLLAGSDNGPKAGAAVNAEITRLLAQFKIRNGVVSGPSGKAVAPDIAHMVLLGRTGQNPAKLSGRDLSGLQIRTKTGETLAPDPKPGRIEIQKLNQALTDEWTLTKKVGRASAETIRLHTQAAAAARSEAAWQKQIAASQVASAKAATNGMISQIKRIPGAWAGIAAEAKAAGTNIGAMLDAGLTVGIQAGAGKVNIVTKTVVDGVVHTATKAAALGSPSKKTIYIGRMLAEGLGLGVEQGGRIAVSKAQNLLNSVLSKLGNARGNASGLASGIAGNLTGGASLSNMPLSSLTTAFGTSYTASPTTAGMTSYLSSYLSRERSFARNLAVARKKGLSAVDAGNIAQMGLDVGGPIAAALAHSSSSQVRHISALDAQINATANALGSSIAQGQYGAEIAKLLREQNALLAALAHKTGVEVANAMKSPHSAKTLATSHTRAQRSK